MAERRQQTNSRGVGSATDSSSNPPRDHGASDVLGANLKTNQDKFLAELDALDGLSRYDGGCYVGKVTESLEEPIKSQFKKALLNPNVNSARLTELLAKYDIVISSDVMRRHRRRLLGKDGCKCPRES